MARETKQDRLVRSMLDATIESLHELKAMAANPSCKESDVERWCQSLFKTALGYTATSGFTFRAQEKKGRLRPDLIICQNDEPICVIEVKKLGADLNKCDLRSGKIQLAEYLKDFPKVKWGFLTNGYEWRLFDFSQPNLGGVNIFSLEICSDEGLVEVDKKAAEELCYDLAEIHSTAFGSEDWTQLYKEATAFSPESLAKSILSVDVVKIISKGIRGEFDYKVNFESLYGKLSDLIIQGMNDSEPGWNETKLLELQKYTRGQMRSAKRKKRGPNKKNAAIAETTPSTVPNTTTSNGGGTSSAA